MIDEMVERPVDGCREVPAELPDPPTPEGEVEAGDKRHGRPTAGSGTGTRDVIPP